ncbi:hypothetical protein [Rubellicoccus peritrichatus]|uniref:Uncharacterized protein n=1 Tax=Rubellicoccus peritrichatus TaxID=3080537 RepID=A0AAQ3LAL2_9BACT|nr:hypothetical protein [Puniceicoccus sp. CR14]WOO41936.1 hypothetical protein RZN69_02465 [Puniceicoccus sp. CR14]
MNITNIGEFAFTMSVFGVFLMLPAIIVTTYLASRLGFIDTSLQIVLFLMLWILFQVPLFLHLKKKAHAWGEARRGSKQIIYVEICSLLFLLVLRLIAGGEDASGVISGLKLIFSIWILILLVYQVFAHLNLKYKILNKDLFRWLAIGGVATFNLILVIG